MADGKLIVESHGKAKVVFFRESSILDESNIKALGEELFELADKYPKQIIVLSFNNVDYLSSAVLGKLMALNKKVKTNKGDLKMCDIKDSIMEVFKVSKIYKVFDIQNTLEDAEMAIAKKIFF